MAGDSEPGSGVRDHPNPSSAFSLKCAVSGNFLNPSMLQFPPLDMEIMKTALSSMATAGLREILVVKLFPPKPGTQKMLGKD